VPPAALPATSAAVGRPGLRSSCESPRTSEGRRACDAPLPLAAAVGGLRGGLLQLPNALLPAAALASCVRDNPLIREGLLGLRGVVGVPAAAPAAEAVLPLLALAAAAAAAVAAVTPLPVPLPTAAASSARTLPLPPALSPLAVAPPLLLLLLFTTTPPGGSTVLLPVPRAEGVPSCEASGIDLLRVCLSQE
jgi:hypothetical protein